MELPVNRQTRSVARDRRAPVDEASVDAAPVDLAPVAQIPVVRAPVDQARKALRPGGPFDCAITFWRGTSGHAYVHSIYALAGCPEVPSACVLLVLRPADGSPRQVLKVMRVEDEAPSLNLAQIRQQGARVGANEVHLHFAAGDRLARSTATFDLATRHGGIDIVGK